MKRQPGDMWGLLCTNTQTGEAKPVQIGGWEVSAFPYRKQAEEWAQDYNDLARKYNHPKHYEAVFVGNRKTGQGRRAGWLI